MDGTYPKSEPPVIPSAADSCAFAFTLIESEKQPLSKAFVATQEGGVSASRQSTPLWDGKATRVEFEAGPPERQLHRLNSGFDKLKHTQAICTGVPPDGRNEWGLVLAIDADLSAGKIARSRKFLSPHPGASLWALDFDCKGYPDFIKKRLEERGGLRSVLIEVWPELEHAACLVRPSSSAHIVNTGTGFSTGAGGEHWFFILRDGRDGESLARRLADRLEADEWIWPEVSKSGAILFRTLIDANASDPARLLFEAQPELGPGLAFSAERKKQVTNGDMLDAASLLDMSADQERTRHELRAQLRSSVADEAKRKGAEWRAERKPKLISRGLSEAQADAALRQAEEGGELPGDLEIHLDRGEVVTVRDIVRNPERYRGATCADPLEPDYHGGNNIAIIQEHGPLRIYSHAHSGRSYELDRAALFDVLEPDQTAPAARVIGRFRLRTLAEMRDAEPPTFLIDRHIPQGGFGFLYGEPGTGKSFLALSMALAVAYQFRDWHGDKIKPRHDGRVLYIAAEGSSGLARRAAAWEAKQFLPIGRGDNLRVLPHSVNFRAATDAAALLEAIRSEGWERCDLVVIDTLSRSIPGADENAQKDMTTFVQTCDAIRTTLDCAVLAIHHSSKQGEAMRGSTVLLGAADFVLKVERKPGCEVAKLTCEKQKDAPDGWDNGYRLATVADGRGGTSLVPDRLSPSEVKTVDAATCAAIAQAVADAVGDRAEVPWAEIREQVRTHRALARVPLPKSRDKFTAAVMEVLARPGTETRKGGQTVQHYAEKASRAHNAGWIVRVRVEPDVAP